MAPRSHRGRGRRDEGTLRLRLRRPAAGASLRPDRVRLSGRGVAITRRSSSPRMSFSSASTPRAADDRSARQGRGEPEPQPDPPSIRRRERRRPHSPPVVRTPAASGSGRAAHLRSQDDPPRRGNRAGALRARRARLRRRAGRGRRRDGAGARAPRSLGGSARRARRGARPRAGLARRRDGGGLPRSLGRVAGRRPRRGGRRAPRGALGPLCPTSLHCRSTPRPPSGRASASSSVRSSRRWKGSASFGRRSRRVCPRSRSGGLERNWRGRSGAVGRRRRARGTRLRAPGARCRGGVVAGLLTTCRCPSGRITRWSLSRARPCRSAPATGP